MPSADDHDSVPAYINNFLEGIVNILIFIPYFFSVKTLITTFFSPWKKIVTTKKRVGFSLTAWANDLMFDLISRGIGAMMRGSLLLFCFIVLLIYILIVPGLVMMMVLGIPLAILSKLLLPSAYEKRERLREQFVTARLLEPEHKQAVEGWFSYLYDAYFHKKPWWKLRQLMSMPPLARDWAMGYTPTLDRYADDLTNVSFQLAIRGHIIGRETETGEIERELSKSSETNVILSGEPGVGRHTIIHALSRKMYEGKTNNVLAYKRLLFVNMEKVLSEKSDRDEQEQFITELFEEAYRAKSVILVIEGFERYVSGGEGHTDISGIIQKYAKTDALQMIGITTPFAYEQHIYPVAEIRTLFTKVEVSEIGKDKALSILLDKAILFEQKHGVIIPYETLLVVSDKSDFFITHVPFPEKALQLLESACIYATQKLKTRRVMPDVIDTVLTEKTHIPTSLTDDIKKKLLHLEELMRSRVIGQDDAITQIASAMRRSFILLGTRKKPLASFLLLGPTGVGKTETAKAIAEVFFDTPDCMIRFDMSLYQQKSDITQLIGSVKDLTPGLLTNAIREQPYGILLLDEIEKAHPDILNIFLTVLDEGYFTDGYGQRVDAKNLVIIATSNAGAAHIHQILLKQSMQAQITDGFAPNKLIDYLIQEHIFSPEFLNRFDGVIAYRPIEGAAVDVIAKNMIAEIAQTIFERYKVTVSVKDETLQHIAKQGYDVQYGARNLERVLRTQIEDRIAREILSGTVHEGDSITL